MNSTRLIVKINFLVLALALVLYGMFVLRHRQMNPALLRIFGISGAQAANLPAPNVTPNVTPNVIPVHLNSQHPSRVAQFIDSAKATATRLNWCETRVTGLVQPNKMRLTHVTHNWVLEDPKPQNVNGEVVDNWLSHHCSVDSEPIAENQVKAQLAPVLFVRFVDGRVVALMGDHHGHFRWNGHLFASSELASALSDLAKLPDSLRK